MAEEIIFITGSTDGIGKATARELLTRGHRVILHGRDEKKGRQVAAELERITKNGPADLFIADLASTAAVRRLAAQISDSYPHLDVLINNAGTYQPERLVTENGAEMTFAVNYLAPFLLTRLLIDNLHKAAPARVVNVASSAHRDVFRIDWNNLQGEKVYDPWNGYALSKFALVTFTYRLSGLLSGSGITVNCLHPGVINTKLLRTAFPDMRGASPEEGSKTSVYLAISPKVASKTGMYYEEMKQVRSEPLTYDKNIQDRLWEVAERLTGITFR